MDGASATRIVPSTRLSVKDPAAEAQPWVGRNRPSSKLCPVSAAFHMFPFPGSGLSPSSRVSLFSLCLSACGHSGATASQQVGPAPSATALGSSAAASDTTSSASDTTSSASSSTIPLPVEAPVTACVPTASSTQVFQAESVASPFPNLEGRALYSWTTLQQAQELLTGVPLLSRTERPGSGPGYALEYVRTVYVPTSDVESSILDVLRSEQFSRARYAWPHAWATRMGWPATSEAPAEVYGDQLLEVVVRPEALWIVVGQGPLQVVGQDGTVLGAETAVAEPDRIVGVFFNNGAALGGATCEQCSGSFRRCTPERATSAYREFILMNPNMIESWSLGTDAIRSVVRADIQRLTQFFQTTRACPNLEPFEEWAGGVVCRSWANTGTEQGAYEASLALMSPCYQARPAEIAAIVSTLEADLAAWSLTVVTTTAQPLSHDDAGTSSRAETVPSTSDRDGGASRR